MIISQYPTAFAASSNVIIPEGHMYWPSCEKFKECFQPAVVTVNIGDEVVWHNQDSVTHTITSGYSSKGPDGNFDLIVKIGHSEKFRFDKPGIFPYFCIVHPWTGGKVVVNDIKVNSISMNVSPSSIFDGEKAVISGQVVASAPIARNTLVYEYETNTGISGSGWVDEGGSIRMNVFWPLGTHTITTSIKSTTGNFPTIFGNSVVLDIKSREPPKTTITLDPMREYGSTTDGFKEFTGKLTTQDGTPLYRKMITVKFETYGKTGMTEFGYTDSSGRYSVPFGFNGREGDWTVYAEYEDGVNYKAAQSNKLVLTIQPVPIPAKTPEPVKTTPTTPEVKSSSATVNFQLRDPFVYEGDTITVIGEVSKIDFSYVLVTVSDPNGNLILVNQVKVDTGRNFVIKIQTDNQYWSTSGQYTITAQYGDNDSTEVIQYTANKSAPTIPPSTSTSTNPSPTSVNSDVILTSGSSVPGCENSNFCFTPYVMNAKVGQTITWYNADSSAHTVTSGVVTDVNSVGAVFDSGLFFAGDTFSHEFTSSGDVPYFCMVHPWMIGEVKVTGISKSPIGQIKDPIVVFTDKSSYNNGDIIEIYGKVRSVLRDFPVTVSVISSNSDIISLAQVDINNDREYSLEMSTDGTNWNRSGEYTVKVSYGTEYRIDETTFDFIYTEKLSKPQNEGKSQFIAFASEADVIIASGSSVLGCEKTSVCYEPDWAFITAGDKVTWYNADSAAHTITSGTPRAGPNGFFDSGVIMPGEIFTHEFTDSQDQYYYCMIHPWMKGVVIVDTAEKYSDSNQKLSLYEFRDTLVEVEVFPSTPMKFKVVFVTSDDECSKRNYESVHHYNLVTDYYLSRYGIDAQRTQYQCITENELDELLDKIESENIELIITMADWELSKTHSGCGEDSPSSRGCHWKRGQVYSIVSNSRTLFTKSDSAAWTLSHELSHFALSYNGEPRSIYSTWVHNIQSQVNQCAPTGSDDIFGYYNAPVNNCPPSLYLAMHVDGKMVRVMQPYYNNNEYEYDTRTELILNELPRAVSEGQKITFSGVLSNIDGIPIGYSTINIKDEDTWSPDSPLVSTRTDAYGKFSVDWTVEDTDFWDNTLEIFAVFEGDYDMQQDRTPIQKVYIYRP